MFNQPLLKHPRRCWHDRKIRGPGCNTTAALGDKNMSRFNLRQLSNYSALLMLLCLSAVQARAGWEIECVGCAPWFEDGFPNHALWAGASGQWLLANGGDGLYLMRDEGSGWTFETVFAGNGSGKRCTVTAMSTSKATARFSGTFPTTYSRDGTTYYYGTSPAEDHVERFVYSLGSWSEAEIVIPHWMSAEEMDSAVSADRLEHLAVQESYHKLVYCRLMVVCS